MLKGCPVVQVDGSGIKVLYYISGVCPGHLHLRRPDQELRGGAGVPRAGRHLRHGREVRQVRAELRAAVRGQGHHGRRAQGHRHPGDRLSCRHNNN